MRNGENIKTKEDRTIAWDRATKEDLHKINAAARRAVKGNGAIDYQSTAMDLEATHTHGCPLDLDKLIGFKSLDFYHDIFGINRHLNRETGELEDCFLPRCVQ